ncbi:MAG: tetratricopeptide repeat protein [Acidimicrobiia bacterium]
MGEKTQHGHNKGRKPPPNKAHKGYGRKSGSGRNQGGKGGRQGGRDSRGRAGESSRPQLDLTVGSQLPKWIQEEVTRTTRKERRAAVMQGLEAAAEAFAAARYGKAVEQAERAKKASPSNATIREILALSLYRLSRWEPALQELRTFRRIAGETTHMPVEMDCLRALDRSDDVDKVWGELKHLGGRPDTFREARVVYGSHLLDAGRAKDAWQVVNPKRLEEHPHEAELRQWYVAARVAAHLSDTESAAKILAAITAADPAFPGLDELEAAIGS